MNERNIMEFFNIEKFRQTDKIAVSYSNVEYTYSDLIKKSDMLCNILDGNGVKKDDKIALFLENSFDFVVCVLTCIRMGCICVPIDVKIPNFRLLSILESCNIDFIFTTSDREPVLKKIGKSIKILFIRDEEVLVNNEIIGCNLANKHYQSEREVALTDIAYILFTSGSTGTPKGVEIKYESLLNYISFTVELLEINSFSKILATSSFSFDASLAYIYCCFNALSQLFIYKQSFLLPRLIVNEIISSNISHYACTPSFFCELIKYILSKDIHNIPLKCLSFGAENVFKNQTKLIKEFKKSYDQVRVFNRYGPTETTVAVMYYEVMYDDMDYIPLGNLYDNIQIKILNERGDEVKEGEIGELYISGIQTMKGYHNDPHLTKEVFRNIKGVVYYKTSDLVKKQSGNEIVFVDRIDDMIKKDGKRVYISEIENILSSCDKIEDVVCGKCVKSTGNSVVVAFLVLKKDICIDSVVSMLKKEIKTEYLLPDVFCVEECIPKTSTGKKDIKKLISNFKKRDGRNYEILA